jgi:hypothetical protein
MYTYSFCECFSVGLGWFFELARRICQDQSWLSGVGLILRGGSSSRKAAKLAKGLPSLDQRERWFNRWQRLSLSLRQRRGELTATDAKERQGFGFFGSRVLRPLRKSPNDESPLRGWVVRTSGQDADRPQVPGSDLILHSSVGRAHH